uniref:Uncharacterized protein n=1 Tax=Falco tinnunculus TaxID=100819 RepID=A0A8C4UPX0_FALTI
GCGAAASASGTSRSPLVWWHQPSDNRFLTGAKPAQPWTRAVGAGVCTGVAGDPRPSPPPGRPVDSPTAWGPSGRVCSSLVDPLCPCGTGGSCHLLGWLGSRRCQDKKHRWSRPDQGWQRGQSRKGRGRGGGFAGSLTLPEPPLGTSLRVLIVAWHKDAFQLPAALPWGRGVPGDNPGLATARNTCTSWARKALEPGWHRARRIPSSLQLLPLALPGTGRSLAPTELLNCVGGVLGVREGSCCALTRFPFPQLAPLQSGRWAHSQPGTMNVFDRNINFDALFKFSHISASTQEHLKRVYASFALCMFVAAAGAYINVVTHLFQFSLLTGLGALALMVWLTATPHSRETEQKRLGMLAGFAFLTGRWALGTLRCPVGP